MSDKDKNMIEVVSKILSIIIESQIGILEAMSALDTVKNKVLLDHIYYRTEKTPTQLPGVN